MLIPLSLYNCIFVVDTKVPVIVGQSEHTFLIHISDRYAPYMETQFDIVTNGRALYVQMMKLLSVCNFNDLFEYA